MYVYSFFHCFNLKVISPSSPTKHQGLNRAHSFCLHFGEITSNSQPLNRAQGREFNIQEPNSSIPTCLKKTSTKGHRGRKDIFWKSSIQTRLRFGPVAPTCCHWDCVFAGEPWPCSPAQENAEWGGMEACTHGLLLIMHLESASNLLLHLEILCLNTNASQPHCSLQPLMPHTSLPLGSAPYDRNGLILNFT